MTKQTRGSYIVSKDGKNHYYNQEPHQIKEQAKQTLLNLTNPVLDQAIRYKRLDRLALKSLQAVGKKLKLDSDKNKQSKLGEFYQAMHYKSRYKQSPRKYIPTRLGIEGFFKALNKRGVDYVILRWFEDLPEWPEGEDIDFLIRDEDMERIIDLFNDKPEGIPTDTYTINGTKGCAFGIAGSYYPPVLGKQLLKNKQLYKETFYIPSSDDHFLSLLYHIVYHKAEKSGLPLSDKIGKQYDEVDHDYKTIIQAFPQAEKLVAGINLLSLHHFLKSEHFAPNIDVLRKLAMKEKSLFLYELAQAENIKGKRPYDVIVFFIREWAFEEDLVLEMIDTIVDYNLEIVGYHYLIGENQARVTEHVRGGNWGKGPYPVSGGKPKLAIITLDLQPKYVTYTLNDSHPFVSNTNVFVKGKVRDKINHQMLATNWVNSLHSSDDYTEAKDYIDTIDPRLYEVIDQRIKHRLNKDKTHNKLIALPARQINNL